MKLLLEKLEYPTQMNEISNAYHLYLCGSRRMAQKYPDTTRFPIIIKDQTDWDFCATYTFELESHLISLGWKYTSGSPGNNRTIPTDVTTELTNESLSVDGVNPYAFDTEVCKIMFKNNCQIVLRNDCTFYSNVFESISQEYYYTFLWKSSDIVTRGQITTHFNQLFNTAHAAEEKSNAIY